MLEEKDSLPKVFPKTNSQQPRTNLNASFMQALQVNAAPTWPGPIQMLGPCFKCPQITNPLLRHPPFRPGALQSQSLSTLPITAVTHYTSSTAVTHQLLSICQHHPLPRASVVPSHLPLSNQSHLTPLPGFF